MLPRVLATLVCLCFCATLSAQPAAGPRDGTYRINSWGATNRPPLFLGSFTLSGGTYEAFLPGGRSTGTGKYSFNAAQQTVVWETGPYAGQWGGAFTVEREGKTHKIRLKSTTIATNNAD